MNALLVGDYDTDDELADEIARTHAAVAYLLDFDDDRPAVEEHTSNKRAKRLSTHPLAFLRAKGIVVPGDEPRPSPVRIALVVEGADPEHVRRVYANETLHFEAHPRGTLIVGDPRGADSRYAEQLGGPVYGLHYNTRDHSFWCLVERRGAKSERFASRPMANAQLYTSVDNILGASTPLEICRVLGVAPELLDIASQR